MEDDTRLLQYVEGVVIGGDGVDIVEGEDDPEHTTLAAAELSCLEEDDTLLSPVPLLARSTKQAVGVEDG